MDVVQAPPPTCAGDSFPQTDGWRPGVGRTQLHHMNAVKKRAITVKIHMEIQTCLKKKKKVLINPTVGKFA